MESCPFPVLIIPAYNPDSILLALLDEHKTRCEQQHCIIINDGSTLASQAIFTALESQEYLVLHHAKNQGKGAALKTGMRYYLEPFSKYIV